MAIVWDDAPDSGGVVWDDEQPAVDKPKPWAAKVKLSDKPKDTRKISYTDSGYRPNKPATTLKEFAKNAVQDIVELPMFPVRALEGLANAPDTGAAALEMGKGLITTPLGFIPGISDMATGRSAGENWRTNPGMGALTVAGAAKIARPAARASMASASRRVAPKLEKAAQRLEEMTLKQPTTLKDTVRKRNAELAMEESFLPNEKGVAKLDSAISATESALQEGLDKGTAAGKRGTLDRAISNVEALREEAKRTGNPDRSLAMIDAEIERLQSHPLTTGDGSIPLAEMQRMKVKQGRDIQKTYGSDTPEFQRTIDKARIRGLKEELELQLDDLFPELASTNKKLGEYYQLKKSLDRASNRIANNQGFGIGLPIKTGTGAAVGGMIGGPTGATIGSAIGAMIGIIEHPAVAPRLARQLHKASKGAMSYADAMKQTKSRIGEIKSKLSSEVGSFGTFTPEDAFAQMEQAFKRGDMKTYNFWAKIAEQKMQADPTRAAIANYLKLGGLGAGAGLAGMEYQRRNP